MATSSNEDIASWQTLKILEKCQISPQPSSAGRLSLSLTFFDLIFLRFHPVQRLLFYELPSLVFELADLKNSLALALHHFYPLAGSLIQVSDEGKSELVCTKDDFVSLTIAASNDDFNELSGDHPRSLTRFHPLVPPLLASGRRQPVLAIQVTVFPNTCVAVGTTVHHAVADGSTYSNFMKLWGSIHRLGEHSACSIKELLPFYDRSVVRDPAGLASIFLKDLQFLRTDRSLETWDVTGFPDVVLSTFFFSRGMLEKLKLQAMGKTSAQCSPNALANGYMWAGLVLTRGDTSKEKEHFGFVTGCRARSNPPIPSNYFGNCLGICCVEAKRSDLLGEDGAAIAADAIWKVIKSLEEEGAFKDAENWIRQVYDYASKKALTVAGSPKLGIYSVDFGWGRPRKVEVISIARTGALSMAESRVEDSGIEIGLALPSYEMKLFVSYFVNGLSRL